MRHERFRRWYVASLVALVSLGAAGPDMRVVDAAKRADTAAVRTLLKQGADVNATQGDGTTALHWAAHWDNGEMAGLLLASKAAVNTPNELGATPLWLACENGSPTMVRKLLESGANPKVALLSGETPLMTAARTGNPEVVKLLVAHSADLNVAEASQGQTALMWAVAEHHVSVVKALLEAGADVQARSLVRRRRVNTDTGGFDNGRNTMDVDLGGYTPLLFAAREGTLESVKLLLDAGANVNDTAPEGTSALVVAAHSGHAAVATFLLEKGADPNAQDAGYTALHAAILRGQSDLAQALLAKGANPNAPLIKATPVRRSSADWGLQADLVGATPFWLAARFLQREILGGLIAKGADPSFVMKDGMTPLMAALQAQRAPEPGLAADPIGTEQRALEVAKVVVGVGVDVNAANKDGNTALHTAASRRLNSLVQFLVENGATIDVKNKKEQTPLAIASAGGGRGAAPSDEAGGAASDTAELLKKLGAKE